MANLSISGGGNITEPGIGGHTNATFTVSCSPFALNEVGQITLVPKQPHPATANLDYQDASYTVTPCTLIPGGSTTINVVINGDGLDEDNEQFDAVLTQSGGPGPTGEVDRATATIVDTDPTPTASTANSTVTEGTGINGGTLTFPITIDQPSGRPITINYATHAGINALGGAQPGSDYQEKIGSVTFPAATVGRTGPVTQIISVPVVGDNIDERGAIPANCASAISECMTFTIATPDDHVVVPNGTGAVGTITDDDPASLTFASDFTMNEGNSGTSNATLAVQLSNPSVRPITVAYNTINGSATAPGDYTATNGTLTFPAYTNGAPNLPVPGFINIPVVGDTVVEPDENFGAVLSNPTNAVIGAHGTALVVIKNDDSAAPPPPPTTTTTPTVTTPSTTTTATTPVVTPTPTTTTVTPPVVTPSGPDVEGPSVRVTPLSYRKSSHQLSVAVTCPGETANCRGTLTVFTVAAPKSKVKQLRKERKLGSTVFLIPAGKKTTLTIKLSRTTLALVKKARRVSVRAYAVAYDTNGNAGTANSKGTVTR